MLACLKFHNYFFGPLLQTQRSKRQLRFFQLICPEYQPKTTEITLSGNEWIKKKADLPVQELVKNSE